MPSEASQIPDNQQPPRLLAELSNEQWGAWRHHPVTQMLMNRYLPDLRVALEREALNRWIAGKLQLSAENEIRARMLAIAEIENLGLAGILHFYGVEPPNGVPVGPRPGTRAKADSP